MRHRWLRLVIYVKVVALLIIAVGALSRTPEAQAVLERFGGWIRDAGATGVLAIFGAFAVTAMLLLPIAWLSLAAGFAYGLGWGMAVVVAGAWAAALLGFALGRTVLRGWVRRRFARDRRFMTIERAVEVDGFRIMALLRISPILPFGMLNVVLAATAARARTYAAASLVGLIPGVVLYVYLGSVARTAAGLGAPDVGPWQTLFHVGGLIATIAAVVLVARQADETLRRVLPPDEPDGEPEGGRGDDDEAAAGIAAAPRLAGGCA